MTHENTLQRLAGIFASRPPWFRARLSTILVWPTTRGGWDAILSYAHYTRTQPGESVPYGIHLTYPHDTDHPIALDGESLEAALRDQVEELESGGEVGHLTVTRVLEPPGKPLGTPPSTGWTILTHSGSEAERQAWERRLMGKEGAPPGRKGIQAGAPTRAPYGAPDAEGTVCGRFSLGTTIQIGQLFNLPNWPETPPRYNIAPSQAVPAVIQNRETGTCEYRPFRWGLIPSWAKDPAIGNRMINARGETAATKPAFRKPLREHRCLILADGFYEWKREGTRKQPYYIKLRHGEPFAFAGLWDRWQPPDGQPLETCTILTTAPNELAQQIHDRMPVILPSSAYNLWLDPTVHDVEPVQALLKPYPADEMIAYPVSTRVNSPANDTPECIAPLR